MRNTVTAMVVAFLICVIMTLPYLMISNVTEEKAMFTNNATSLIIDSHYALSQDFMSDYMCEYLPYCRWFGLQLLPMCIVFSQWCTAFALLQDDVIKFR